MNKKPMRVVLEPSVFDELNLNDPQTMLRARAAFYLGYGLETIRLYVRGGTYEKEADDTADLAIWLGMTDEDIVIQKVFHDKDHR